MTDETEPANEPPLGNRAVRAAFGQAQLALMELNTGLRHLAVAQLLALQGDGDDAAQHVYKLIPLVDSVDQRIKEMMEMAEVLVGGSGSTTSD